MQLLFNNCNLCHLIKLVGEFLNMQKMQTHFCRLNGLARPDVDGDGLGLVLKVPEVTLHELLHLRHIHFLKFFKHKADITDRSQPLICLLHLP